MLIYAVADIHSQIPRIDTVRRNISRFKPDVLVIAGDLTRYFRPGSTVEQIASLSIPTIVIRGNTDSRQISRLITRYPNISSPHLEKMELGGYAFVGLNGTIPFPFRSQVSVTEGWSRSIEPMLSERSILIAHPPPRKTLDAVFFNLHAGSPKIREIILKHSPLLYICGHIHESSGHQYLGSTLVVNCSMGKQGEGALIRLTNNSIGDVTML